MASVKLSPKGQIVIPSTMRKKFGMVPSSEIHIFEYGGLICIVPPVDDPVEAACGCLPPEPSLAQELLEDRRKESQDER